MARTPSTMRELGTPLPAFELPDTVSGKVYDSKAWHGRIVVVAFICSLIGRDAADLGWACLFFSVIFALVGVWTY